MEKGEGRRRRGRAIGTTRPPPPLRTAALPATTDYRAALTTARDPTRPPRCEFANWECHCTLAALDRSKPKRRVPDGKRFLFSTVTAPHYFFEIMSWVGFNLATGGTRAGWLFNGVGALIMLCWAVQKHERHPSLKHTPLVPFVDVRPPGFLVAALAK